jgi:hypothetical protein
MKEQEDAEEDLDFKEMTNDTAREELRKLKEHDKAKLCNISWLTCVSCDRIWLYMWNNPEFTLYTCFGKKWSINTVICLLAINI